MPHILDLYPNRELKHEQYKGMNMAIFSRKSKSDAAWETFQKLLPKYLKNSGVDWSRKLDDELPRLKRDEAHDFLSHYGDKFFAHIMNASAHDERRLNYLPELVQMMTGYQDEKDLVTKRIFAEDMLSIISQIGLRGYASDHAKVSILMLARDAQEIDLKAGRKCGFLNQNQRERLVFGLLDRMTEEYLKNSKCSYIVNIEGLLPVLGHIYSDEGADFSRKVTEKITAHSELFDSKRYFEFVINVLAAQSPEVCAEGLSTLQSYIEDTIDKHKAKNDVQGYAVIADKIRAIADTGYTQDYKNAVTKPRVFIRHKNKVDCSALVVRFNDVANDNADYALFVEHTLIGGDHVDGTVTIDGQDYTKIPRQEATHLTSDIRASLLEHYGAAGEALADKLEEQESTKPLNTPKIQLIY